MNLIGEIKRNLERIIIKKENRRETDSRKIKGGIETHIVETTTRKPVISMLETLREALRELE